MSSVLVGQQHLQYGTITIEYELTYSDRKTLAIHVYPDGSIVVDAPVGTALPAIEQRVRKRAGWIVRQQRQFQDYAAPKILPRRYVSGESFGYLGRQYRLKVLEDQVERVVLSRGFLTISVHDPSDKKRISHLIERWSRTHARQVFSERLNACYPRVESLGIPYPELIIRDMKSRWGSCTSSGRITLNLKLLQVPKRLIDYVILHELCHLKEHNHSTAFYTLLDRVQADWRERRQRLNAYEIL